MKPQKPFSAINFLFGNYTITQRIRFFEVREELRKKMEGKA